PGRDGLGHAHAEQDHHPRVGRIGDLTEQLQEPPVLLSLVVCALAHLVKQTCGIGWRAPMTEERLEQKRDPELGFFDLSGLEPGVEGLFTSFAEPEDPLIWYALLWHIG